MKHSFRHRFQPFARLSQTKPGELAWAGGAAFSRPVLLAALLLAVLAAGLAPHASAASMSAVGSPSADRTAPGREIVFIDTGVEDWQTLADGVDPAAGVILVRPKEDGMKVMADTLAGRSDVQSVHVLGHGGSGSFTLGSAQVDAESLDSYATELGVIQNALGDQADLLLYGCYVGADDAGQAFIAALANATGADVAASNNATGNSQYGGDWDLEITTGAISTAPRLNASSAPAFKGLLANLVVTTLSDETFDSTETIGAPDGSGLSLREAIGLAASGDLITFDQSLTDGVMTVSTENLWVENKDLTIDGGGVITVAGSGVSGPALFYLSSSDTSVETVTLRGLTFSDGGGNVDNADFTGNWGAVTTFNVNLAVDNSTFANNETDANGAAINFASTEISSLTIQDSTFHNNVAEFRGGAVLVTNSFSGTSPISASITGSTFRDNQAGSDGGAIILNDGTSGADRLTAVVENSTFYNNLTTLAEKSPPNLGISGHAIRSAVADVTLNHVSIVGGGSTDSGALVHFNDGSTTVNNSYIQFANPTETGSGGSFSFDANTLVSPTVVTNLGTLGFNGGPTQTIPVLTGSNTIDASSDSGGTDQRSFQISGTRDLGAYEYNAGSFEFSGTFVPADGATGVDPTANLLVDFGSPVTAGSGDITITNEDTNSTFESIAANGARITITNGVSTNSRVLIDPVSQLPGNTNFSVQIAAGAFSSAGESFAGISDNTTWNFTSGASLNNAPVFTSSTTTASFAENGTGTIFDYDANDGDGGTSDTSVTYSLGGTDAVAFGINASGQLTFNSAPNFEAPADSDGDNSYTLDVIADDGAASNNTTSLSVTVTVTDVNEAPSFSSGASASVAEDAANGSAVIDVDANVGGAADEGVTYTIETGNIGGAFAIDGNTGEITVADASAIDFESSTSFSLTVRAAEGSATADQTIAVSVTDVAPAVADQTVGSVSETAANGTVVGTVATTQDSPTSFSITGGNAGTAFAIDNNGQITVTNASAIDFEAASSFSLTVQASDGTNTDSATVTINVTDVGPAVANQTVGPVSEGATNGTGVGTVATTQDAPTDFFITGGNTGTAFAIDSSGQLTVADGNAIDFESATLFSLTVQATDGTNTDTGTVTINVTDIDETPTFTSTGPFSVNDSAGASDAVGNVDASVGGPADTGVTYSIIAGNDDVASDGGGAFVSDANTGAITVNDADDIDSILQSSFTLTVQAAEGAQTQTTTVTVNVIDDVAPLIAGSIAPSVATITDAQVGTGTFTLTVNFNEAMNIAVAPTLSFPTGGEDPTAGGSLANSSGLWTDSDTYVVTYDVTDQNAVIRDIDVRVENAQDAAGNTIAGTTQNDIFSVITAPAPEVDSITSASGNGTFGVGDSVSVTVTFGEGVDFTANSGSLQATLSSGQTVTLASADATNQTAFSGTYTIGEGQNDSADLNVTSISLTGGATLTANDDGLDAILAIPGGQNLADNQDIVVDANTPLATQPDLTAATDTGTSDSDNLTNNATPAITGTTEAGATVSVRVGAAQVGTTTADGSGAWSYTFSGGDLSAGAANLVDIIASDAAGNTSADSPDLTITLDTGAPTLSAVDLVAASDTGTSNTDDITNDTTPTIAFTAESGAAVAIDWGDGNGFTADAAGTGGTQQATLGTAYATDGARTITVRATDAAGNQTTQMLGITVDTGAETPTLSPTTANTDPFTLTVDFGQTVTGFDAADITLGGIGGTVGAITDQGNGRYAVQVDPAADGTLTVDIAAGAAQDVAGNATLAPAQLSVLVDTTAPMLNSITRLSPLEEVTNANTLTFRATFDTDVQNVDVSDFAVNGTTTATVANVATATADSVFDVTVSGGDLASFEGTVGLDLAGGQDIVDIAGNVLPTAEPAIDETYTLDNTGPELSSIVRQTPADETTNADTLTFRATFDMDVQNVDATDFVVAGSSATVTGISTVSADTVFDLTVSGGDLADFDGTVGLDLAAGQDIADAAGNALPTSEPGTDETFTVDNTAPAVTVNTLTTSDTTPPLSGTVDDNDATLELTLDGQTVTPTNNGDGTWTLADDTLAALALGTFDVAVTATDPAGNEGSDATADELTITTDSDGDGIDDSIENAGPNGGDGNNDSTPDAEQSNVASVPTATGRGYMTLATSGACTALQQVAAVDSASLPADPDSSAYPFGLVEFRLSCETAIVEVVFHDAAAGELADSTYRKYGPVTPGDTATTAWYDFSDYATLTGNTWTLDLADDRLGDDTGDDGIIVDQGGPSIPQPRAEIIPVNHPWALWFMLLALLALARRPLIAMEPRT